MKSLIFIAAMTISFIASSQEKGVEYIKINCSGITYKSHERFMPEQTDSTVNRSITVYLSSEKSNPHLIFKEAGKVIRYKGTYEEDMNFINSNTTTYSVNYDLEDGRRFTYFTGGGRDFFWTELDYGLIKHEYNVTDVDFEYKE